MLLERHLGHLTFIHEFSFFKSKIIPITSHYRDYLKLGLDYKVLGKSIMGYF